MKPGIAGRITAAFIDSPLTPLVLLAAVVVGLIALFALPREEEPQISVPLVDIQVRADGLDATDAVELVTKPLEEIVTGIDGVEHIYSRSEDNRVMVTARFFVGTDEDDAILRVHETIQANLHRIPVGVPPPLIVGRGINDVAILVLTLSPEPAAAARWSDVQLHDLAEELQAELVTIPDVGVTALTGGRPGELRIEPDPARLALYGVTLNQLIEKIAAANRSFPIRHLRAAGGMRMAVAGQTLAGEGEIGSLLVTTRDGRPVYVRDLADIHLTGGTQERRVWHYRHTGETAISRLPAVQVAVAKRAGANAVVIAEQILERVEALKGPLIPPDVSVTVTRNHGETASDKADELLATLFSATAVIVLVIALTVGWREGIVVLVVVPSSILLALFTAWVLGYTINRVSLFALIFSIGILVDDAIVVVENTIRHWRMTDGRSRVQAAIDAVAEVGNPTLFSTATVIAALLPMLFVSGMMGPYMAPIPVNATGAMVFSTAIALIVTPWLMVRLAGRVPLADSGAPDAATGGRLGALYARIARPILAGKLAASAFLVVVGLATIASFALIATGRVPVKLLPFDNKAEIQVVVDLPEGSGLEATDRVLDRLARALADLPELVDMQAHAGVAAPFNFNGLVRHYYLRGEPWQGDLQLNLTPKHARDRSSHAIALDVRQRLAAVAVPPGTSLKVVEVPPGPPVLATLLAEIYGPDGQTRRAVAARLRALAESVDFVVDVDDSFGVRPERLRFRIDRDAMEFFGVEDDAIYDTLQALLGGVTVGYSHRGEGRNPIAIRIAQPRARLAPTELLLATPVPGAGGIVELGDLVRIETETASWPIFRRNGRFAEMVTGELAGRFEAPIYGILAINRLIEAADWGDLPRPAIRWAGQPQDPGATAVLWDGEWEITLTTFRDLGLAFAVALLGIYLIVVGQFGNYRVPLVILTPIPLTLIGILIGHWVMRADFTATSMIGFIALAGVMVRNSILLVDFIGERRQPGLPLRNSLIDAGAIRFRPIVLTSITSMIGAAFILADPIFQGLAVSLLFGLASSTLLTVLVIPAIYIVLRDDGRPYQSA